MSGSGAVAGRPSSTPLRARPLRWTVPRLDLRRLWAAARAEVAAQADRTALWAPVAYGAGAASYFGLKTEPMLWPGLATALVGVSAAGLAVGWGRSRALAMAATLAAFAACGFAGAELKTAAVSTPVIAPKTGVVTLEGWVADVTSPNAERGRLLIAPVRISRLSPERVPARIRVTVKPEEVLGPGSAIRVQAVLNPPPGPASPGGYDFARDAFFERVGGVGLALKPPELTALPAPSPGLRAEMAVNSVRWSLARRLSTDITRVTGDQGAAGLAAAVTTSHESWLAQGEEEDLRGSGLAHMLAIAGLHTAAVTGFVFWAVRLAVACSPWLALRVPGKKVAAAAGLAAVVGYLMISGAHPPAKRAAVTAGVAFLAMLLDRRAISLRSLAIAALIILILQPEAVVQPGFQMSFCATASLVAMAEIWPHRVRAHAGLPWQIAWPQRAKDWLIAMMAVSFVAGAATGPFALQHFNRMATYGVFANLTADFLASAALMPSLVLSGIGEAVGLPVELLTPVLALSGWCARGVLAIGHYFTNAPGASHTLASAPDPAMLVSLLGILFACLWKGWARWIGVPLAFAVWVWPRPPAPVGWLAADGNNAAVVQAGRIVVLKPKVRAFATQAWSQKRGLTFAADEDAARDLAFDCDRRSCAPKPGTKPAIAAWWSELPPKPGKLEDLCPGATLLIVRADVDIPPACAHARVLTREDFQRGGAAELFAEPSGLRIFWAQAIRGERPWSATGVARDPSDTGE